MVLFQDLYCQKYRNYVEKIKEIQSILGIIQDCFVLEQFLQQILQKSVEETII